MNQTCTMLSYIEGMIRPGRNLDVFVLYVPEHFNNHLLEVVQGFLAYDGKAHDVRAVVFIMEFEEFLSDVDSLLLRDRVQGGGVASSELVISMLGIRQRVFYLTDPPSI